MMMGLAVRAMIVMVALVLEQPCTSEINEQTQCCDGDGLIVVNRRWRQQPFDRLIEHQRGNGNQEDRARITAEHFNLPGAESNSGVVRLDAA